MRTFDPRPMVASFDGQTPTAEVVSDWQKIREDFEREQELRSFSRMMTERISVCG